MKDLSPSSGGSVNYTFPLPLYIPQLPVSKSHDVSLHPDKSLNPTVCFMNIVVSEMRIKFVKALTANMSNGDAS